MANKTQYFEYFLDKALEWYKTETSSEINDISILKSLKLLFFVSAVNAKPERAVLIDEVFTKFVAMPLGPVESEIHNEIKSRNGQLEYFNIDNFSTRRNMQIKNFADLRNDYKNEIDNSFAFLQETHPKLITNNAFELVDLSHLWYSWNKTYQEATMKGFRSLAINHELIKNEDKIFAY